MLAALCAGLAGCGDTLNGPIDLFHNLEGGEIAAQRPPPPGVGMPFPKLGTVPAKPVMPDPAYRQALQTQLTTERDRTERVAADTPIAALPPPPPAATTPPARSGQTATANATLDTAEAPPQPVSAAVPQSAATSPINSGAIPSDSGPTPGTALTIAGAAPSMAGLPDMPATPPPPAAFEGVAGEPTPTPRLVPIQSTATPAGTLVFFPIASATLPVSQTQALKDFAAHRANHHVEILGLGNAASDTPDGQATAIALGLARAHAVADALANLHVPPNAIRLGANAFGDGAVARLVD